MKAKYRHIIKTITWRIIGTIDTILLGWLFTGDPMIGIKIGGVELITKMTLYYFHEKAWFNFFPFEKVTSLKIDMKKKTLTIKNEN